MKGARNQQTAGRGRPGRPALPFRVEGRVPETVSARFEAVRDARLVTSLLAKAEPWLRRGCGHPSPILQRGILDDWANEAAASFSGSLAGVALVFTNKRRVTLSARRGRRVVEMLRPPGRCEWVCRCAPNSCAGCAQRVAGVPNTPQFRGFLACISVVQRSRSTQCFSKSASRNAAAELTSPGWQVVSIALRKFLLRAQFNVPGSPDLVMFENPTQTPAAKRINGKGRGRPCATVSHLDNDVGYGQ